MIRMCFALILYPLTRCPQRVQKDQTKHKIRIATFKEKLKRFKDMTEISSLFRHLFTEETYAVPFG